MIHYNDELKEFHSKVARKKHLEVVLQDLWAQEQELVPKVAELEQIKMDEQEDVERLEGGSLATFFYSVVGKMDEKLDKERQEAYMASVKFDAAVRQLETVEYEIEKSEKELEELKERVSALQETGLFFRGINIMIVVSRNAQKRSDKPL